MSDGPYRTPDDPTPAKPKTSELMRQLARRAAENMERGWNEHTAEWCSYQATQALNLMQAAELAEKAGD